MFKNYSLNTLEDIKSLKKLHLPWKDHYEGCRIYSWYGYNL